MMLILPLLITKSYVVNFIKLNLILLMIDFFQMNFYVLATCFAALVASGFSASVYPAGVDPNACPE
jgi:hypothetical protein